KRWASQKRASLHWVTHHLLVSQRLFG
ncbi:branched-chain amino acid transport system / permease component family protein, partial [Vibrio parahaemolyticus V-223/04]